MSTACSDKNFKEFWKESTKVMNSKSKVAASVDGLTDHSEIANMFIGKFVDTSIPVSDSEKMAPDGRSLHISEDMIFAAIKRMKLGKSVGHDGISVEHLRFGGPWVVALLSVLFNVCLKHSYLPREMLKTMIAPIVKNKTNSLSDSSNYRPISLATTCAKLYDSILLDILSEHFAFQMDEILELLRAWGLPELAPFFIRVPEYGIPPVIPECRTAAPLGALQL
ncbi:hypothetical protein NE865_06568 [Phthorimaea operculella]|nr:hypothetical protein NE865_06568 [Phthorimaea operculella]